MPDQFSKWTEFAITSGVRLLGIFLFALILNRLLKAFTNRLIRLAASETRVAKLREQQTRTLAGILYSAGTALIFAIAILTALPEFGVNVTPIATLAGLASLAVGFGAQHLVRDLINGFFVVFEDQFVVGDTVRIGETLGRVEHVTLRRTVLRDPQGALVTIPNGEIRALSNFSRDWSQLFVDVQVAAEKSVDAALVALEKVCAELRNDPAWSAALVDGPRVLGVESLTISGPTLRVQVRTAPNRQHDVARELRRRIKSRFDELNIGVGSVHRVELIGTSRSGELTAVGEQDSESGSRS